MMGFIKFVTAMVLLAGWGLAALSLHVVRTANGVQLIPKNNLAINDTYVDVRHWTSDDEDKHAAFYARLKQLDRTDVLKQVAEADEPDAPRESRAQANNLSDAWYRTNTASYRSSHR
ncbi:hypothetical protein BH10PLA1_BH10PLA1_21520 [soil metagenome]